MHTTLGAIEYNPAKADANQRKRGVGFADAEQALRDPLAAKIEDLDAEGEPRFLTLGMDAHGRVLAVAWTSRGDRVRALSARKASRNEAKTYAR